MSLKEIFVDNYHSYCINEIRGYIFRKLLLALNISCINKNCFFFIKETDIKKVDLKIDENCCKQTLASLP